MNFEFEYFDKIEGPVLIKPRVFGDDRGYFLETFREDAFKTIKGMPEKFVQDNHSKSSKNVLRGLHFQKEPKAQGKLVTVISGSIMDVAVDIRKNSKTYGQHIKVILDDKKCELFYIPTGFAHGFLSLEDNTHILYKCTEYYSPEHDSGILWNDSELNIDWEISNPLLSDKDKKLPSFNKL